MRCNKSEYAYISKIYPWLQLKSKLRISSHHHFLQINTTNCLLTGLCDYKIVCIFLPAFQLILQQSQPTSDIRPPFLKTALLRLIHAPYNSPFKVQFIAQHSISKTTETFMFWLPLSFSSPASPPLLCAPATSKYCSRPWDPFSWNSSLPSGLPNLY